MGDGSLVECSAFQFDMIWNDAPRTVEALLLEHNPLIGTMILDGSLLTVELREGGEVIIELPE